MIKRLIIFCILIWASSAWGGTAYYVECGGSGTDSGTFANPFTSLTSANAQAYSTGDDLYFKSGSTCTLSSSETEEKLEIDWSGSSGDVSYIGCYDGDGDFDCTGSTKPIFQGTLSVDVDNDQDDTEVGDSQGYPDGVYVGVIHLDVSSGIYEYITVQDLDIQDSGCFGILIDNTGLNTNHITIQRNNIERFDSGAIVLIRTNNSTVTNNTVIDGPIMSHSAASISISGNAVADGDGAYSNTVSYNTVEQCRECVNLWNRTRDNIIEYNVIRDPHDMGIYASESKNNIYRYNLIYYTDDWNTLKPTYYRNGWGEKDGFRVDSESPRLCFLGGNEIYGNFMSGGDTGIGIGCGRCVTTEDACWDDINTKIYNNTIVDFLSSIDFYDWATNNSQTSIEIKNNISYHTQSDCQGTACIHANSYSPAGVTWANNAFNDADDNTVSGDASASNVSTSAPGLMRTSSFYNQAWSATAAATLLGYFKLDPDNLNSAVESPASPLDLGDDYDEDYWTTDRDPDWDIGAHEYDEGTPPSEPCDDTIVSGDLDYCLTCGPCEIGEGDCDLDSECVTGAVCAFQPGVDYCAADTPQFSGVTMAGVTIGAHNIYYVDQDGSGGGGSYYSLSQVSAGAAPFDDLDGYTVCFSGTLTSAGTYGIDFRNADNVGTSESWIVLDGSGEGDCSAADPATLTLSGANSYGIITNAGTGPSYMEIKGFTIRNTDTDINSMGIYIRCADEGLCESVYIHDNDVQIYGGSAETLTVKGIYTDGAFNHLWVYDNTVIGLNEHAYDGIHLTQLTNDGDSTDLRAYNNICNDWQHGNIVIALIGASGTGTVTGAHIYGNTVDKYNRGYGQGVGFNAQTQYAEDAFSEGYIHDNIIRWNRAPNQMEGKNIAFYRNIIYNVRNVCPPADPESFDDRYAGQPAYFGDENCQEEVVWDWSFELNGWGRGYSMLWNSGQGIVASLGYTQGNAYFQNTIYSTSEAAFQYRGGTDPTTDSNVKIVGNIFAENNILSIGNGWSANSTSNTVCTAEDVPYDWCTGENAGSTADPYRTYTEDAGDSNPPGSKDTEADCPIWIADIGPSNIVGFEIKNNVIYTAGNDKIFCHSDASIGEKLYTLIEAQGTGGTGDGDWGADELVVSDNANSDPLMLNPASGDFTLAGNSPAIDRGFWTYVDGNSSDNEFAVDNALFLGAPGETIKTAAGEIGVIASINYATNTITTVDNIIVVDNEGIGLFYKGTSLDAGAIEYNTPTGSSDAGSVSGVTITGVTIQ